MNYHAIKKCNMNNYDGLRVVLFVSGCSWNCVNCHNPETHDPNSGILFDIDAENEIYDELSKDWCAGITISGGDPFYISNRETILKLVKNIKFKFPDKSVCIYTGYVYELAIRDSLLNEILKYCDVLIDGQFLEEFRDKSNLPNYRGSSNQRIIHLENGKVMSIEY